MSDSTTSLRNIRGKYACACCQTIQAAPMPSQMIDKGIPAPGLNSWSVEQGKDIGKSERDQHQRDDDPEDEAPGSAVSAR